MAASAWISWGLSYTGKVETKSQGAQTEQSEDDEDSAEEDKSEEELLIATPSHYEQLRPWSQRDVLVAGACIVAWYATSVSMTVANKSLMSSRREASPQQRREGLQLELGRVRVSAEARERPG